MEPSAFTKVSALGVEEQRVNVVLDFDAPLDLATVGDGFRVEAHIVVHRVADALGQAGVTRICALGAMTSPEAGWHHDGRFNLLDLVRMVEIEASAERAADALAPYAQEIRP